MKKIFLLIITFVVMFSLISCTNKNKEKESDDFLLGKYPQSQVTDEKIIAEISKISKTNSDGYIEYEGNEYVEYKDNYYLVEPIKWKNVKIDNKTYYVTDRIIDSQVFMSDKYFAPNLYSYVNKPGVPENTHANNYQYSDLRDWLNSYFISNAFTSSELKKMEKATIDNSLASTTDKDNIYICENTTDTIFALSAYEASFLGNEPCKPTDYAVARGVVPYNDDKIDIEFNGFAAYWLRSPSSAYSYRVSCVNYDGMVYRYTDCYFIEIGVRPAFIYKA